MNYFTTGVVIATLIHCISGGNILSKRSFEGGSMEVGMDLDKQATIDKRAFEQKGVVDCAAINIHCDPPKMSERSCKYGYNPKIKVSDENDCSCVSEYECCGASCPILTDKDWKICENPRKYGIGKFFPVETEDCCDCNTVICLPCMKYILAKPGDGVECTDGTYQQQIPYNGKAGATSSHSSTHSAQRAFQGQGGGKPWANRQRVFPATVWYKFAKAVTLSKISLKTRKESQRWAINQAPRAFKVVGSDDCSTWKTMLTVGQSGFNAASQTKEWTIPCIDQTPYRCVGVTFLSSGSAKFVAITDIKMFQLQILHSGLPGHNLKVYSEKKTWNEARQTCQANGGDLVIVDKPAINAWLSQQDKKLGNLWIGASDMKKEGKFVWINGEPVKKNYFRGGNPDNWRGGQDCVVVNWRTQGEWDDQGCNGKNGFVCSHDEVNVDKTHRHFYCKNECDEPHKIADPETKCPDYVCRPKPAPAYPEPKCNSKCHEVETKKDDCGHDYNVCKCKNHVDCTPDEPEKINCLDVKKVLIDEYSCNPTDKTKCMQCHKWEYALIEGKDDNKVCKKCEMKVRVNNGCHSLDTKCECRVPTNCHPEKPTPPPCTNAVRVEDPEYTMCDHSQRIYECIPCYHWNLVPVRDQMKCLLDHYKG